jgi:hypothetical protein
VRLRLKEEDMTIQLDAHTAMKRLLLATTLGVVLVLASLPARAESRPSGYPITIEIRATAKGDQAMPFNFAIQPGRVIEVRIRNYTRELHTFAIPAIGLNVAVLPGTPQAPRTMRASFVVPRYGVYKWYCVTCRFGLHMHHKMGGKLYAWISPDVAIG